MGIYLVGNGYLVGAGEVQCVVEADTAAKALIAAADAFRRHACELERGGLAREPDYYVPDDRWYVRPIELPLVVGS